MTAPAARPRTRDEHADAGKATRTRVPRETLGHWSPATDRADPVALLAAQETTRVPELLPVRHERMAASPFAFYRGAACVFAADMASGPHTGLDAQLCGDAHLANFGVFASPERSLVFDINDFDETLRGPFEWDVKRLAASFEVAARALDLSESQRASAVTAAVRSYCRSMREFAGMSNLDVWYTRLTVDAIAARWADEASRSMLDSFRHNVARAESKDRLKAFDKLTATVAGERRFVSDPPLLEPVRDLAGADQEAAVTGLVDETLHAYVHSLQADRCDLIERYRLVDVARKVVGVGSVGTRCWVALLIGHDEHDPLILQVKEAEASVLEPHLGRSGYEQHGQRVVEGQRLTQATPDVLLGWARSHGRDGRDHDYYFRQLWDWKGSAPLDAMTHRHLEIYGEICGYALARAHARSGSAIAISAYTGGGGHLSEALTRFAAAYADQNDADHRAFTGWVAAGGPPPEQPDVSR